MIKRINPDDKIFKSVEFLKDKYEYDLVIKNLKNAEVTLYSDEENYFICGTEKKYPAWIWTKNGIDVSLIKEIEECINLYLNEGDKSKFVCKKELYQLLVEDKYENLNPKAFEMGFYICEKIIKPQECDGYCRKATVDDLDILTKYSYDDHKEMIVEDITIDEARKNIQDLIDKDILYVWINNDEKIVSMAHYKSANGQSTINTVYTPRDERRRGYAANLVYYLTSKILDMGNVPLLYTDYNYLASNKCYKKIGYEEKGVLINFSCSN